MPSSVAAGSLREKTEAQGVGAAAVRIERGAGHEGDLGLGDRALQQHSRIET